MQPKPPRDPCTVPDCGRRAYARGLCQTHHRQLVTTGRTTAIRPYRRRKPGTVKFAGLRLSPRCARALGERAERRRVSESAVIADLLEEWYARWIRRGGRDPGPSGR